MTVAFGLDDGPDLSSVGRTEKGLGVATDCPEVDGEAGALHACILCNRCDGRGFVGY
jgi:hypothetical protein